MIPTYPRHETSIMNTAKTQNEQTTTDDPDELRMELAIVKKNPEIAIAAIQAIEVQLRYGIPSIKFLLWIVIALLGLILWRLW